MQLGDCCKSSSISLMDNSCSVVLAAMDAGLTITVTVIIFIYLYHHELRKSFVLFYFLFVLIMTAERLPAGNRIKDGVP